MDKGLIKFDYRKELTNKWIKVQEKKNNMIMVHFMNGQLKTDRKPEVPIGFVKCDMMMDHHDNKETMSYYEGFMNEKLERHGFGRQVKPNGD